MTASQPRRPMLVAAEIYHRDGRSFVDELRAHLTDGFVVDRPEAFALVRAVSLRDNRAAWMVNIATGNLSELALAVPFALPFIAFYRKNRKGLRVYPFDRFLQKCLAIKL